MEVRIKNFSKVNADSPSKIKAILDITFDGVLTIRGVKIVEGDNGLFVSYPRKKKGETEWENIIIIEDIELVEKVEEKILSYASNKI